MPIIAPHYYKAKKKSLVAFFKKDRYLIKTPWWLKKMYPGCLWDMPKEDKTLYISFDDGPHPTITPFILNELKKYNAKATFFCIGDNVVKFPAVYNQLIEEGHSVGNHTQHHINGWKTTDDQYLQDIKDAKQHIHSPLFRPPYGRITKSQMKLLRQGEDKMKIVMWNILAGDWDPDLKPERCFERVKKRICNGDIIVFHDSEKAWDRMQYAFPKVLEHFAEKGYLFKKIS